MATTKKRPRYYLVVLHAGEPAAGTIDVLPTPHDSVSNAFAFAYHTCLPTDDYTTVKAATYREAQALASTAFTTTSWR